MTKNSKILIVDDDSDLRNFVRLSIDNGKRDIVEAETALEGLHAANESPPDILLLDVMVPGSIDGLQLCELIKSNPKTRHKKVLILSVRGQYADVKAWQSANADDYMVKPFSPRELINKVEALANSLALAA